MLPKEKTLSYAFQLRHLHLNTSHEKLCPESMQFRTSIASHLWLLFCIVAPTTNDKTSNNHHTSNNNFPMVASFLWKENNKLREVTSETVLHNFHSITQISRCCSTPFRARRGKSEWVGSYYCTQAESLRDIVAVVVCCSQKKKTEKEPSKQGKMALSNRTTPKPKSQHIARQQRTRLRWGQTIHMLSSSSSSLLSQLEKALPERRRRRLPLKFTHRTSLESFKHPI